MYQLDIHKSTYGVIEQQIFNRILLICECLRLFLVNFVQTTVNVLQSYDSMEPLKLRLNHSLKT